MFLSTRQILKLIFLFILRFGSDGGLSPFDNTPHSVWLTAWCIKIYKHVAFQDWEDYIYIDPYVSTDNEYSDAFKKMSKGARYNDLPKLFN